MVQNALIESIKAVGKRMKKHCDSELKLAHAYTGIAHALRFKDWRGLVDSLAFGATVQFRRQMANLGEAPDDAAFQATVTRFSESTGLDWNRTYGLCVEFLLPAILKWKNAGRNDKDVLNHQVSSNDERGDFPASQDQLEPLIEPKPLLAATIDGDGVRLSTQGPMIPVVVRKRRRVSKPFDSTPGSAPHGPTQT